MDSSHHDVIPSRSLHDDDDEGNKNGLWGQQDGWDRKTIRRHIPHIGLSPTIIDQSSNAGIFISKKKRREREEEEEARDRRKKKNNV